MKPIRKLAPLEIETIYPKVLNDFHLEEAGLLLIFIDFDRHVDKGVWEKGDVGELHEEVRSKYQILSSGSARRPPEPSLMKMQHIRGSENQLAV